MRANPHQQGALVGAALQVDSAYAQPRIASYRRKAAQVAIAWLLTRGQDRKDLPIRTVVDYLVETFDDARALFDE